MSSICAEWQGAALKSLILHQDPIAVYPETFLSHRLGVDRVQRLFLWFWNYLKRLSRGFHLTVAGNQWYASRLRRFGLENARAVPLGIVKSEFRGTAASPALRHELLYRCRVSADAALLIGASRHHPKKRLGTLIDAVEIAGETSRVRGIDEHFSDLIDCYRESAVRPRPLEAPRLGSTGGPPA